MPLIKHRYDDMAVKTVTRYVINRKDIMLLDNVYLLMHEWLIEHGYVTRNDAAFPEQYYLHKEGPERGGKEIWWRWRPQKDPMSKSPWTDRSKGRWRFDFNIDVHVLTMKDVEAVIGGKKYKAQQGEVEIQIAANLITDPVGQFQKSMFKDVKKLLFNRLWKQEAKMMEDQLYKDALEFRDVMNTHLTIDTFLPTKEWPEFWPKRVPE